MIKASLLQPSLARLGKIVIGEKVRPGKSGTLLPTKLDHFAIKTLQRDAEGRLVLDKALMGRLGERPTVLRIRLPFDDIEANFQTRLSYYRGRTLYCSGDGEEAKRLQVLQENGKAVYGPPAPFGPCGASCPDFIERRCKPLGILRVILEEQQTVGGIYEFRTTSWNSIRNILSGLATVKTQTGGVLAWVPLVMRLVPQTVQPKDGGAANTAYVVQVVFDGSPQALLEKVRELLSLRAPLMQEIRALEAQQRALQAAEEPEDAADTQDEFYPELSDAGPPMVEGEMVSGNGEGDPPVETPPATSQSPEPPQATQDPPADTLIEPQARSMPEPPRKPTVKTPQAIEDPKTRPQLERAITRKLRELVPGDDATAKQERLDLIKACWDKEGWRAIMALNDKTLRAGWNKLAAMRRDDPPAVEDDDVPPLEDEEDVGFDSPEHSTGGLQEAQLDPEAEAHVEGLRQEREAAATEGETPDLGDLMPEYATPEELADVQRRYVGSGYGENWAHAIKEFPGAPEAPQVPRAKYLDMLRVAESLEKIARPAPAAVKK